MPVTVEFRDPWAPYEDGYDGIHIYAWPHVEVMDPEELVTDRLILKITIDYPLSRPYHFTPESPHMGFTRGQLMNLICEAYQKICREEVVARNEAIAKHLPHLKLPHGIWGHGTEDLVLVSAEIHDDGTVVLGVES